MRRRLVAALAGLSIATLLFAAIPRAVIVTSLVRQRQEQSLERSVVLFGQVIDSRLAAGEPVTAEGLGALLEDGEYVAVRFADGRRVEVGTQDVDGTTATRPLASGGEVTLSVSDAAIDQQVADALESLVLLAVAAVLFALLVALVLSRRLVRPFLDLASHAEALSPDSEDPAPRSGLPEAERIADALDASRARAATLLRREREFSANASHQIRTPLSALRVRIEDLTLWPEVPDDVRTELVASLDDIGRLSATVTDLLELARSGGMGGWRPLDLHSVAGDTVLRWSDAYAAEGRELALEPVATRIVVRTSEQAIGQVLDVMLENALVHGRGRVTVSVEDTGDLLALRVGDEGHVDRALARRMFERNVRSAQSRGSGIGLALAATVAEAVGGRVRLRSTDPMVVELSLARDGEA